MQSEKASMICANFLRAEMEARQSEKLWPLMMAKPLPPPQQ